MCFQVRILKVTHISNHNCLSFLYVFSTNNQNSKFTGLEVYSYYYLDL